MLLGRAQVFLTDPRILSSAYLCFISFLYLDLYGNFVSQGIGIYKIHFYCLAVEAGFNSDVVECWPVNQASWVRFLAGACKIFSLYDNGAHRK